MSWHQWFLTALFVFSHDCSHTSNAICFETSLLCCKMLILSYPNRRGATNPTGVRWSFRLRLRKRSEIGKETKEDTQKTRMSTMWQVLYLRLSSGPTGGTVCFLKFSRCTQSTKSSKKKASGLGVCTPQTKRPKRIPAYLVMICQLSSENPPFIMCHFIAHVVKREKNEKWPFIRDVCISSSVVA